MDKLTKFFRAQYEYNISCAKYFRLEKKLNNHREKAKSVVFDTPEYYIWFKELNRLEKELQEKSSIKYSALLEIETEQEQLKLLYN